MKHLLTVDVEASFRGMKPSDAASAASDPGLVPALDALLDLLAIVRARATFFVLGDDAGTLAGLLPRCVAAGHEVACHGMRHTRVDSLGPDGFRGDLRRAVAAIEETAGARCIGYRAPWFSAPAQAPWFFDILREEGMRYDASLRLPVEMRMAGTARAGIRLLPVPLLKFGAARIGAVGGLALRILPRIVVSRMVARCETYGQPACVYLHPYEWRSALPGAGGPARAHGGRPSLSLSALRRHLLLDRTLPRLRRLTEPFEFTSIRDWLGKTGDAPVANPSG